MKHTLLLMLSFAAAVGCSPTYGYVPLTSATVPVRGPTAADYPVPPPPEAPDGSVRIASHGVTKVAPPGSGREARALDLRVVLANKGLTMWTFNTNEQRLDLYGIGMIAPAFASADAGSPPPFVTVPPNGERITDLFFVLPARLQQTDNLPRFDAVWSVNTGTTGVAERTPFERLVAAPAYGHRGATDRPAPLRPVMTPITAAVAGPTSRRARTTTRLLPGSPAGRRRPETSRAGSERNAPEPLGSGRSRRHRRQLRMIR